MLFQSVADFWAQTSETFSDPEANKDYISLSGRRHCSAPWPILSCKGGAFRMAKSTKTP